MTTTQSIQLDPKQLEAISLCCDITKRIVGVTGSAGTGKTTIMKQVHDEFEGKGYEIALAAPTGKAAKRISEATGIPAVTLHRLLEFSHPGDPDPKTGKILGISVPRRRPDNPLIQSVILVDEYSMVNKQLHRDLIDAMSRGAILRVFGDVNQLPPIEEDRSTDPSPFANLLRDFPNVRLETIHRQGEGSSIVKNGARILNGMLPFVDDDFIIHWTGPLTPQDPVTKLSKLVVESGIDFNSVDNQIITPINKSWVGQKKLNNLVQHLIHGDRVMVEGFPMPRNQWDKEELVLVSGDKILWTKNDYNLEIFNGETGIVKEIKNDVIYLDLGDRVVGVPPDIEYVAGDGTTKHYDPRKQIDLAYAVTTHKSQGSEYQTIVYIIDRSTYSMQHRGNFYTGVTRARSKVHVISDRQGMSRAVAMKDQMKWSK